MLKEVKEDPGDESKAALLSQPTEQKQPIPLQTSTDVELNLAEVNAESFSLADDDYSEIED